MLPLELTEIVWPLIWQKDKPKVLLTSNNEKVVFRKGDRVIPPKQLEFVHSMFNYKATFFGGGAGGGKSYMLAWCMVIYLWWLADNGFPRARGGMFGETHRDVLDRQFKMLRDKQIYPDWLGRWVGGTPTSYSAFIANDEFGGWRIEYKSTDNFQEHERSTEYAIVGIDESTNQVEGFFRHIMTRARWSNKETGQYLEHTPVLLASNPMGPGIGWHLDEFVKPWNAIKGIGCRPAGWVEVEGEWIWFKGHNFIKSLIDDNPHLGPQDRLALMSLPDRQRWALLDGRWDVFQTQFMPLIKEAHQFSPDMQIPPNWPRYLAVDYARNHSGAAYAAAMDPRGHLWVYAGFEERDLSAEKFKDRMLETFREPDGTLTQFLVEVADRTMFGAEDAADGDAPTPVEVLNRWSEKGHYNLVKAGNVPNSRIPSWQALREMTDCTIDYDLDNETGIRSVKVLSEPRIHFSSHLNDLWEGFLLLERNEDNPEDCYKTKGSYSAGRGDDGPDCVRYIVMCAVKGDYGAPFAGQKPKKARSTSLWTNPHV